MEQATIAGIEECKRLRASIPQREETRRIGRIKDRIEEVIGRSIDLKEAVEIYEMAINREDMEIADNVKSFWIERASGASK